MITTREQRLSTLKAVLHGLMRRYQARVPDVEAIIKAMVDEGIIQSSDEIENDHIAFRTMGVPQLGIQSFEKIFLHYGYERRDAYHFPAKKLDAFWYAPPSSKFPRIFVSELRVPDLTPEAARIIRSYTDQVQSDPVDTLDLDNAQAVDEFLHRPLWRLPTYADYQRLLSENEYAAWVIYNRYYLNHFTISIHNLPAPYGSIERFNEFLEEYEFPLNSVGGTIKRSADGLLLQSATVAETIEAEFAGGERHEIPGSYVEFAERKALPQYRNLPAHELTRIHRREGFETDNADKIFESTFVDQVAQRQTA